MYIYKHVYLQRDSVANVIQILDRKRRCNITEVNCPLRNRNVKLYLGRKWEARIRLK